MRSTTSKERPAVSASIWRGGIPADYDAYIPESKLNRLCKDVYFREYLPQAGDTVVDIGAGYGHEAMFCRLHSPSVRYIGVEV